MRGRGCTRSHGASPHSLRRCNRLYSACVSRPLEISELSNDRVIQPLMKFWLRNPEPLALWASVPEGGCFTLSSSRHPGIWNWAVSSWPEGCSQEYPEHLPPVLFLSPHPQSNLGGQVYGEPSFPIHCRHSISGLLLDLMPAHSPSSHVHLPERQ